MAKNVITLNRGELARMNRLLDIKPDGCWRWKGEKTTNGYAKWSKVSGAPVRAAHRVIWEHYHQQQIPEGMQLDHLCRVRDCVNPEHFEVVTPSENTMRQNHFERNKVTSTTRKTHASLIKTSAFAGRVIVIADVCEKTPRARKRGSQNRVKP